MITPFEKKQYDNYEQYTAEQKAKLKKGIPWLLTKYVPTYRKFLRLCFKTFSLDAILKDSRTCLCLGARQGTEVEIFNEHGIFAIGIDLNPGEDNKYVVVGDASQIQYPDNSIDIVYTNSLDHFLEIQKVLEEIKRVLVPGGFFIFVLGVNSAEDKYRALSWENPELVIRYIGQQAFNLILNAKLSVDWFTNFVMMRTEVA